MSINVGVGVSVLKEPLGAAQEALQRAKANFLRERIDLVFIFATPEFSYPLILKSLNSYIPQIPIIGCSGAAIISRNGILKHGILIMLASFTEGIYFNTGCVEEISRKSPLHAGEELGEKLLYGFKNIRRDLSLIFSDGVTTNNQELVDGLQEMLGRSFPLVGACASNNLKFIKNNVFFNQNTLGDAACGILWGGKLSFGLGIKHGWKPLGKPRHVTKSAGNVVYAIDQQPATRLYEEYLDCDIAKLKNELKFISGFYPIGVYIPGEEEYLLRNIRSIEDNGALVLQGNVPENSQIRLMIGTKESCLTATHQAINEAIKELPGHQPDIVFVFDSISRYMLLGRSASKELDIIKEGVGPNCQIAGVYTYGELAPMTAIGYRGKAYLHNQTVTFLAIGG